MFKNKIACLSLLSLFILTSFIQSFGSVPHSISPIEDEGSLIKNISFLDSQGIVEPVIEIANGGSFQQHIQKFKKHPGTALHASLEISLSSTILPKAYLQATEHSSVPIYLFNRNILI